MTPLSLRVVLVTVAAFVGSFLCVVLLGKLTIFLVGPLGSPSPITIGSIIVGLLVGIVIAALACATYVASAETKVEERRILAEENRYEQVKELQNKKVLLAIDREDRLLEDARAQEKAEKERVRVPDEVSNEPRKQSSVKRA